MERRRQCRVRAASAALVLVVILCGAVQPVSGASTTATPAASTRPTPPRCAGCTVYAHPPYTFAPVTTGACGVKSATEVGATFAQPPSQWPSTADKRVWAAGYPDPATDVNQLMVGDVTAGGQLTDTTSLSYDNPAAPTPQRYKVFPELRPQGDWILVDVENADGPVVTQQSPQHLQVIRNNGYYSNLWVTNVTGTKWFQLTHFSAPAGGSPGAVGILDPQWSPDGRQIAFPETYKAPDAAHRQGFWNFYLADFTVSATGVPRLTDTRKIDYPGDVFYEMQSFAPNGRSLTVQTVFPGDNAYAPNIAEVDIAVGPGFGRYTDVTNAPASWNEHSVYSPDGQKIAWASSLSFPSVITQYGTLRWFQYRDHLHNELFLMNANGTDVEQLTWFNDPSSPEHSPQFADALFAEWNLAGTELLVHNGVPNIRIPGGNSTWLLTFNGACG